MVPTLVCVGPIQTAQERISSQADVNVAFWVEIRDRVCRKKSRLRYQNTPRSRATAYFYGPFPAVLFLIFLHFLTFPKIVYSSEEHVENPNDLVTVHGQTIQGRVVRLGRRGVEFTTIYGEGRITIAYDGLEDIVSQNTFLVFHGKKQLARGWLLGIEEGQLLVGVDRDHARRVPVEEIEIGMSQEDYDSSLWTRLRTGYRYWRGSLGLGYTFEEGGVDKNKTSVGLNLERRKRPTRFVFDFAYAYEIEKTVDSPERTTKNELVTFLQAEYDVKYPVFLFVRPAYEFDKPRNINYRWYPAAGFGYRVFEDPIKRTLFQIPLGIGYVDEDFGNIGTNAFVSWYIGARGSYEFGSGVIAAAEILYMPGIEDPGKDKLFRVRIDFTVPVFDPLALKLIFTDVRDNNPTPEVGENKTTFTFALSVVF